MSKALQKLAPKWHDEAANLVNKHFNEIHRTFLDSTKKAVWLGLFLNDIKARGKEDGSIPHGQFGAWLENNVPDVSVRQAQTYMTLAANICEKGKFEIRDFRVFANKGELPPKIEKMIEGQTQQQLFLEFKNVDGDGNPRKPGQQKGSKGLTKEMRMKAAYADQAEHLKDLKVTTEVICDTISRELNLKGFAALDETPGGGKVLEDFIATIADAHLFFTNLKKGRSSRTATEN